MEVYYRSTIYKGVLQVSKIWSSYEDVDRAVITIKRQLEMTGTIAPELVSSYKETLSTAGRGLVQRFYEQLTALSETMPQVLTYFITVPQKYFVEADYQNQPVQLYTFDQIKDLHENGVVSDGMLNEINRLVIGGVLPKVNLSGGVAHPTYLKRVSKEEYERLVRELT